MGRAVSKGPGGDLLAMGLLDCACFNRLRTKYVTSKLFSVRDSKFESIKYRCLGAVSEINRYPDQVGSTGGLGESRASLSNGFAEGNVQVQDLRRDGNRLPNKRSSDKDRDKIGRAYYADRPRSLKKPFAAGIRCGLPYVQRIESICQHDWHRQSIRNISPDRP